MVNTTVDGTFRQANLTNESPKYLAKREELRLAEIELMRQRERVAELRRHLPQGAAIQDYRFEEGPRDVNVGDAPGRTFWISPRKTAATGTPASITAPKSTPRLPNLDFSQLI